MEREQPATESLFSFRVHGHIHFSRKFSNSFFVVVMMAVSLQTRILEG